MDNEKVYSEVKKCMEGMLADAGNGELKEYYKISANGFDMEIHKPEFAYESILRNGFDQTIKKYATEFISQFESIDNAVKKREIGSLLQDYAQDMRRIETDAMEIRARTLDSLLLYYLNGQGGKQNE